jgi:hypothetical protein
LKQRERSSSAAPRSPTRKCNVLGAKRCYFFPFFLKNKSTIRREEKNKIIAAYIIDKFESFD